MKKLFFRPQTIPLAFLLLCAITYGLLIPWLGFYWDDWPYTWFAHTLGPAGLLKALSEDRPFLAAIYMTTTTLLGSHPITWQIFAIFSRWLLVLSFWWSLLKLWPQHRRPVTYASFLFAVYPGFLQSWISVIYSQAFLLMSAFVASLGMMIAAVRAGYGSRRYWLLTGLAMLLSAFSFFSTEYFFGVELIRPVLIWIVLAENAPFFQRRRILPTLLRWAPYLLELLVFGVWRAFFFEASTYQVQAIDKLSTSLGGTVLNLLQTLFGNAVQSGWFAWEQAFNAANLWDFSIRTSQLAWVVILATLGISLLYLLRLRFEPESAPAAGSEVRWSMEAMLAGGLGLLFSSLPFWAAGLPFNLLFPYNRFTLAMMFGACLLAAGVLEFFIRTQRQKLALLALLVSFAAGYQFQTANTFRREWELLRSFFWQVTWRMPGLKPGTILLTNEFPFQYYSDNSLSAPLNWIYAPDNHSQSMPYILDYLPVRAKNTLPDLEPGNTIRQHYRALTFTGSMSQAIVLQFKTGGCVRVLDATYTNGEAIPGVHYLLKSAAQLTNLDQILTNADPPARPQARWFGSENTDNWCYYFEKADLARQVGDWQQISALAAEAAAKKLDPVDPSEWAPFIEGLAHTGSLNKAASLSKTIAENLPNLQTGMCQIWERLAKSDDMRPAAEPIQSVRSELQCTP